MDTIKKYLQNQSIKTDERTTEEQPKHHFNNNSQYDLLLCSIYIISENTNYTFNDIVKLLDIGDIIYNGL